MSLLYLDAAMMKLHVLFLSRSRSSAQRGICLAHVDYELATGPFRHLRSRVSFELLVSPAESIAYNAARSDSTAQHKAAGYRNKCLPSFYPLCGVACRENAE